MANVIQQKFGTATPASDSLAKGELAIRFVAANHTASSSSKLFFGEGDSANLRQFGFGITDGSTQSGVAIGENLTFAASGNATVSVSGQTVTIGASGAGSVTGPIDFPTNSAATFDNTNNNSQTFIRNGGSNGASLQLGVGSPGNENTKIHMADDGDVGIGTVSPGSKLDIVSTSDNNTAGIRIGDGTNFAALYTDSGENFIIDPTNDFIVTGADDIKLQSSDDFELIADDFYFKNDADDSTMMRITSDGNVGIGTTSPNSKLTVQGDLDIPVGSRFRAGSGASGVNTGVDIYYNSDSSSTHHTDSMIETRSAGGDLVFRNLDNGQGYQFYANDAGGTENFIMGIDGANQRVGIGTTSPLQPLHVSSDENHLATFKSTDSIAEIRLQDNAAFTRLLSVSSKLKLMPNDGVELMVLDGSAEKVGIGTDSPVANLHISDSDSADVNLMLSNSNTGHTINDGFQFAVDTSKHAYIINRETADLKFYTSNAQRMVVDSTGNVGIDATSPSYKLTLGDRFMWDGNHFRANKTFAASMRNEDPSSTNPVFTFDGDLDTGMSRAAADELSLITGGTEAIRIDSSQRVGIGTDSPTSAVHLASATASEPVVTIENTNADGTPPGLTFFKNTTSPATEDQVGSIKFDSKEETSGDTKTYWEIQTRINDATNTTPNGQLNFYGLDGDSPGFIHQFQFINSQFSVLDSNGVGPTLSTYDTNGGQLKTTGTKLRLQAKSDSTGEIHMMANNVGIGNTSPSAALDVTGAFAVSGNATIGGSIVAAGDITADVEGDLTLDVNGGDIRFKDDGTEFGKIKNSSSHLMIESAILDKDILFKGNDNGSTITALRLHMASEGMASFNADVQVGDDLRLTSDSSILGFGADNDVTLLHIADTGLRLNSTRQLQFNNSDEAISSNGTNLRLKSGGTTFIVPSSDGSSGQFLKTDGAGNLSFATVSSSSGDITSVVAGDGMTGGGTTGDVTLNVVAGDGITMNPNSLAVSSSQTTIQSVLNQSLVIGRGTSHANIDFSTDNEILFDIDGTQQIKFADGSIQPVTDDDIDLGADGKEFKDLYIDGTAYVDALEVSGNMTVDGNLDFAGSARHIGDTDTNFSFTGSDTISIQAGGAERVSVNQSGMAIGTGARVTTILDEDNMTSNSATALATQQSIKAYVDANAGSGDIEGVTAGDGLTGGGSSGSVTLAVTAANTNLTSIINDDFTKLGRNAGQEYIDFTTTNQVNTYVNNVKVLSVTASSSDGIVNINKDLNVSNDISLNSDAAVLKFGNDQDVTLTHVADTGLRLNASRQLQFNDSDEAISSSGTNLRLKSGGTTFLVPSSDGTDGQFLKTDGAGNLSFATVSGDITGVTAGTGLSGGGDSGAVTLNVETTQTINTLNSTGFLLDSSGDITLDAAGEDIIFKDAGSERVRFNIGNGCETDITGDYHLDSSGSVKIDAATDITLEAAGDDIIFTDGGDERFRFNLDGTPDMVGSGNTSYRASGELTLDTDDGIINFKDAGITRMSFDMSDGSPEMDVTGDFTIDGTGNITLDCAASSDIIISENGGTYTPTADNHVATKKYVDDNSGGGGGGGSGTVNSGTANAFAYYASGGTTVSDTIESQGSITMDLSGQTPEFMIYREDSTTAGNNGLGRIEMGNTDFSSNRSQPNIMLQGQSGGHSGQAAGSQGGCALIFKTIINGTSTLQNTFKIHSDGTLLDSSGSILMNEAGPFSSNGDLLIQAQGNGTCDFNLAGSDERIKHEIDTYEYGLKEIEMLNPKYFKYSKEGYDKLGITGISDDGNKNHFSRKRSGFIAQDIEKAMPEGVVYEHDDGIKSYQREGVIAALVNAVKELSARVKELEGGN